jgi:hypothetical protein
MADDPPKPLNAAEAKAKAAECLEMAKHETRDDYRIMLEHMAETWERMARRLQNGD